MFANEVGYGQETSVKIANQVKWPRQKTLSVGCLYSII